MSTHGSHPDEIPELFQPPLQTSGKVETAATDCAAPEPPDAAPVSSRRDGNAARLTWQRCAVQRQPSGAGLVAEAALLLAPEPGGLTRPAATAPDMTAADALRECGPVLDIAAW